MCKNLNQQIKETITNIFHHDNLSLALSTGTPGPFRKITAMIMDSGGNVLGFAKIGETPLVIERIKNEAKILKLLVNSYKLLESRGQVIGVRHPECLYEGTVGKAYLMIQTPPPFDGKSGGSKFNADYAEVLNVLIKNTMVKRKFIDSEFYKNLKVGIETYPLSYRDILIEGFQYLEELIGDKEIIFALSHGDFTPWNMVWSKDKKEVFIYDWESACFETPAGLDLIHFLYQTGFLLKKLRGDELLRYITGNPFLPIVSLLSPEILILFYLLNMAVTEDHPQQLNGTAVERRRMIKKVKVNG